MSAKTDYALEVCYSKSCISKRTGLSPQAIEDLKRRGQREPQGTDGPGDTDVSIGIGGFEIGGSLDGDISLSIPGISLSVEDNGEGSLEFPGNMRMDVVKEGCFWVKNFYVFDQLAYQNIELDPDCEEEEKDEEEYDEDIDFEWDESELPEDENDPKFDEDPEDGFNEGDDGIHDNDLVVVYYNYRWQEMRTHTYYISTSKDYSYRKTDKTYRTGTKETARRKGVRYPTQMWQEKTTESLTFITKHEGPPYVDNKNTSSSSFNRISHEYGEPSCENSISNFELGWGRTIKNGAKQRRTLTRRYNKGLGLPRAFSVYRGKEKIYENGEFIYKCPHTNVGSSSDGGLAYAPDDRQFSKSGYTLAYRKVIQGREEKGKPPGNIGKKPPKTMDKDCCKLIKKIYKALAVDELEKEGFVIPSRLTAPNATGTLKADNYLEIAQLQTRIADHLGIHPFKAKVKDVNAAQKGNQGAEIQTINATSAAQFIVASLIEESGDSATRLNLQLRIAVAVGQILSAVSIASKGIDYITRFLGIPRKRKVLTVEMPFDFTFGKGGEGFGSKKTAKPNSQAQNQIDKNKEKSTEALLPSFMQQKDQPIIVEEYDSDELTLLEAIQRMNQ